MLAFSIDYLMESILYVFVHLVSHAIDFVV